MEELSAAVRTEEEVFLYAGIAFLAGHHGAALVGCLCVALAPVVLLEERRAGAYEHIDRPAKYGRQDDHDEDTEYLKEYARRPCRDIFHDPDDEGDPHDAYVNDDGFDDRLERKVGEGIRHAVAPDDYIVEDLACLR